MNRTVSVIIPCFNGEKFIDQSIESIYIQDYAPIELIVVDDESTDCSADRINAWEHLFAQKGHTLKYIWQKNLGPGGAIDTGLKHVTGQYLTLLDADDILLPGAIRKKVEFLDAHSDYAGVRNNGWRVSKDHRQLFITSKEEKNITDLFTALSERRTNNWAGTYMVRTDILFEAYPDRNINPSRLGQNFQILLPVSYGRKFGYIDEPLMEYRIQTNSHSQASDQDAQYKKGVANSLGWREIYRNITDWLIIDKTERQMYQNKYDAAFYRAAMDWAKWYGRKEHIARSYNLLKETGYMTIDDRIVYASVFYPFLVFPLRVVRKLCNVCTRRKRG